MLGGLEVPGVKCDGVSVYTGKDDCGEVGDGGLGIDILGTSGLGLMLGERLGVILVSWCGS
jgi:hypothetical protein